jgi:hypothetical protein
MSQTRFTQHERALRAFGAMDAADEDFANDSTAIAIRATRQCRSVGRTGVITTSPRLPSLPANLYYT